MTEKISEISDFDKIDLDVMGQTKPQPMEDVTSLEEVGDLEAPIQTITKTEPELTVPNLDQEFPDLDAGTPETNDPVKELLQEESKEPISVDHIVNEPEPSLENIPLTQDSEVTDEIFDPCFEISKIKTTKYQTRKTERTDKEKIDLAEKIRLQGQLEPVHVVKEPNGEFQLVAGFGRIESLIAIGRRTVKAIVHLKYDQNEITKVSFGTNEGRTELSDWDKICSVGSYVKNNPLFPLDDPDDPNSVSKIFGYSKETIYKYIKFYKYFITQPDYLNLFRIKRFPAFVYGLLYDFRADILKVGPIIEYLLKATEFSANKLKLKLADIAASVKIQEKVTLENQTIDPGNESQKIAKELLSKLSEEERKQKSDIEKKLNEIIQGLGTQKELIRNLMEVPEVKKHIDSKQFKDLNRVIKEITQLHLKLA